MSNKRLTAALLTVLAALIPLGLNVFEVHADTFGMNSIGTDLQAGLTNLMMGSRFSLSSSGTVSSVSVYVDGSPAGNVKVAIYDDDATNALWISNDIY